MKIVLATIERATTQAIRSLLGAAIAALGGYVIVRGAHGDAVALTNALLGAALMAFGCFLVAPGPTGAGFDFLIDKIRKYRSDPALSAAAPLFAALDAPAKADPHVEVPTFPTEPS
jgi:hypothetical protein